MHFCPRHDRVSLPSNPIFRLVRPSHLIPSEPTTSTDCIHCSYTRCNPSSTNTASSLYSSWRASWNLAVSSWQGEARRRQVLIQTALKRFASWSIWIERDNTRTQLTNPAVLESSFPTLFLPHFFCPEQKIFSNEGSRPVRVVWHGRTEQDRIR